MPTQEVHIHEARDAASVVVLQGEGAISVIEQSLPVAGEDLGSSGEATAVVFAKQT